MLADCVNPKHLEPVTGKENTLRGETIVAANRDKTHCPQGHSYDEGNTILYEGRRYCHTCNLANARGRREYNREYAKKNREQLNAKRKNREKTPELMEAARLRSARYYARHKDAILAKAKLHNKAKA